MSICGEENDDDVGTNGSFAADEDLQRNNLLLRLALSDGIIIKNVEEKIRLPVSCPRASSHRQSNQKTIWRTERLAGTKQIISRALRRSPARRRAKSKR